MGFGSLTFHNNEHISKLKNVFKIPQYDNENTDPCGSTIYCNERQRMSELQIHCKIALMCVYGGKTKKVIPYLS